MPEYVEGWEGIARFFPHLQTDSVRKKYGKTMLKGGFVYKSIKKIGKRRAPTVWTWKENILRFQAIVQAKEGKL